jgi:hypothetical protein
MKGDRPKKQMNENTMCLRWNDMIKTKSVKYVSMLSIIHTGGLVDNGKKDRSYRKGNLETKCHYRLQRYRAVFLFLTVLAEMFLDISD